MILFAACGKKWNLPAEYEKARPTVLLRIWKMGREKACALARKLLFEYAIKQSPADWKDCHRTGPACQRVDALFRDHALDIVKTDKLEARLTLEVGCWERASGELCRMLGNMYRDGLLPSALPPK